MHTREKGLVLGPDGTGFESHLLACISGVPMGRRLASLSLSFLIYEMETEERACLKAMV